MGKSTKSKVSVASDNGATLDVPASSLVQPSDVQPSNLPDLQAALDALSPAEKAAALSLVQPSGALTFADHQTRLKSCIRRQQKSLVLHYVERGEICLDAIDVKTAFATDKNTRAKAYSSSVTALLADAIGVSCDLSEPAPNIARWVGLAGLARKFPRVLSLPSVRVAVEFCVVVGQTSKPSSYDAPISFVVHPRYPIDAINALIERAIGENLSADDVAREIQIIGGKITPKAVDDVASDPFALARTAAKQMMDKVNHDETPMDAPTFFAEFLILAGEYGYSVAPSRDGKGSGRYSLVK